MLRIEPQPPLFPTVEIGFDTSYVWCLKNQAAFQFPDGPEDWLKVKKPHPAMEPKLIDGIWYWVGKGTNFL